MARDDPVLSPVCPSPFASALDEVCALPVEVKVRLLQSSMTTPYSGQREGNPIGGVQGKMDLIIVRLRRQKYPWIWVPRPSGFTHRNNFKGILDITYNILRFERCTPDSDVIEKLSNINILVTIYTM